MVIDSLLTSKLLPLAGPADDGIRSRMRRYAKRTDLELGQQAFFVGQASLGATFSRVTRPKGRGGDARTTITWPDGHKAEVIVDADGNPTFSEVTRAPATSPPDAGKSVSSPAAASIVLGRLADDGLVGGSA